MPLPKDYLAYENFDRTNRKFSIHKCIMGYVFDIMYPAISKSLVDGSGAEYLMDASIRIPTELVNYMLIHEAGLNAGFDFNIIILVKISRIRGYPIVTDLSLYRGFTFIPHMSITREPIDYIHIDDNVRNDFYIIGQMLDSMIHKFVLKHGYLEVRK